MKKIETKSKPINSMREVLDVIERGLRGQEANALWEVLTALRGPDEVSGMQELVKEHTTARIRYAAFGGTPAGFAIGAIVYGGEISNADLTDAENYQGIHFARHARRAAIVLGIYKYL